MSAEEEGVEAGEGRAEAYAAGQRERNHDGPFRVFARPVEGAEEPDAGRRGQACGARAHVVEARRAVVITLGPVEDFAGFVRRASACGAESLARFTSGTRGLLGGATRLFAHLLRALAHFVGVLVEVEVLAETLGFGTRALRRFRNLLRAAPRRVSGDTRALFDALPDIVFLVKLARFAPRRLAPLVETVSIICHALAFRFRQCRVML